jgi:hypothetical protein
MRNQRPLAGTIRSRALDYHRQDRSEAVNLVADSKVISPRD